MQHHRFSNRSLARMKHCDERIKAIAHRALQLSPHDFGIPEFGGLRSTEQQKVLFDRNVSNADGVVNLSNHQSGRALDFYAWVNGEASWKIEHLAVIACAFLKAAQELDYKLATGGLWVSFQDWPHVELID